MASRAVPRAGVRNSGGSSQHLTQGVTTPSSGPRFALLTPAAVRGHWTAWVGTTILRSLLIFPFSLLLLSNTATAQDVLPQLKEGERRSPAVNMKQLLVQLQGTRKDAKSQLTSIDRVSRFAKLGSGDPSCPQPQSRAIAIPRGAEWPSDTTVSFLVAFHKNGGPSALLEVPSSCSGDWSNEYVHYFDSRGRTVAFERFSGFFNGCDVRPVREISVTYYTPTGTVLAREYRLEDPQGRKISPTSCEFMYRYPYVVHRNWTTAARAAGLPATVRP